MAEIVPMTELEQLRQMLADDPRNSAKLSRLAGVGYFWLVKMRKKKVRSPAFEPTRKLFLFLKLDSEKRNPPMGFPYE